MIVPFASATFAQGENVRENATIFINYYNSKDFLGATSLFHFPADYTANELKEDKDAVSKTLNMYYEEFGRIASIERKDNVSLYYFVSIGGGNLPYWQKYPNTYNLFYKVNFSREGQGYVVLVFCNISDKWEIRQVNYGLPADRPESQERISGIFMKWVKLRGQ
jgi:hypothetical protein